MLAFVSIFARLIVTSLFITYEILPAECQALFHDYAAMLGSLAYIEKCLYWLCILSNSCLIWLLLPRISGNYGNVVQFWLCAVTFNLQGNCFGKRSLIPVCLTSFDVLKYILESMYFILVYEWSLNFWLQQGTLSIGKRSSCTSQMTIHIFDCRILGWTFDFCF